MVKFSILSVIFIIVNYSRLFSQSDYCIKILEHQDSYYESGEVVTSRDITTKQWIGEKRFALVTANRNYIFNYDSNFIMDINKPQKIYFTVQMPMNLKNILDSASISRMYKIMGNVKETSEEKIINDYRCKGYEIENYMIYKGVHLYDVTNKSWITDDVPFNLEIYSKSIHNINRFTNFDEQYLRESDKIKGISVRTEITIFQRGDKITRHREVTDISKRTPGSEVYSVPDGFTKKEKITLKDIQGR